jgi:hypothetical protein
MWIGPAAWGQSIPKTLASDVKAGVGDILAVWAAPFHASGRDYLIGASTLSIVGVSALADRHLAAWIRTHPNAPVMRALRPAREGQGDFLVKAAGGSGHTPGAFGVYTVGLLVRSPAIRDLGMGCLAAAESHTIVRQLVYAAVSRERPLYREQINDSIVDRAGRPYAVHFPGEATAYDNSFFSGHAASVFSCVTFANTRFHLRYAEPVLWAMAGALSMGRAADQHHYLSDVLVGSVIGIGAGKLVAHRSLARAQKGSGTGVIHPDSVQTAGRSWRDGIYISRQRSAIVLGWQTPR